MKKLFSVLIVAIFVFATTIPAQALSLPDKAVEVSQTQQLPSFLPNGAVSMTDVEMAKIQGEALPLVVVTALGAIYYYGLIYGVPFAINYAASLHNGTWMLKQTTKDLVKQYFGW